MLARLEISMNPNPDRLTPKEGPGGEVPAIGRRLAGLTQTILDEPDADYDPFLYSYWESLRSPSGCEREVRHLTDLFGLARRRPETRTILDAGCGFGAHMLISLLLGAKRVSGVETYAGMVKSVQAYVPLLPEELSCRFDIVQASVTDVPFEDGEFDVVLSNEAISHYLQVDGFIAEAARVLKPGGVVLVSDGNNDLNFVMRRRIHRMWEAFELGPGNRVVEGYPIGDPCQKRRTDFVATTYPGIDEADRERIAKGTFGKTYEEVAHACDRFLATGQIPKTFFRPGVPPVDPDGVVPERLFDPHQLGRAFEQHGFAVKVYGHWGGAAGNGVVRAANRALRPFSSVAMRTARAFRIVAVK
jgi:SAM-dependent methyltransferase